MDWCSQPPISLLPFICCRETSLEFQRLFFSVVFSGYTVLYYLLISVFLVANAYQGSLCSTLEIDEHAILLMFALFVAEPCFTRNYDLSRFVQRKIINKMDST